MRSTKCPSHSLPAMVMTPHQVLLGVVLHRGLVQVLTNHRAPYVQIVLPLHGVLYVGCKSTCQ